MEHPATEPPAKQEGKRPSGADLLAAVEDRLITVRWDSGSESVFVPSAGSLQVTGHRPPAGEGDSS